MMIDDDTLKQLLRIDDELMQLCKWLNEKRDMETLSRLIPTRRRADPHSDRSGQEQITLTMQPYKGYFIERNTAQRQPRGLPVTAIS
jgi:hypothetical protein